MHPHEVAVEIRIDFAAKSRLLAALTRYVPDLERLPCFAGAIKSRIRSRLRL